MNRSHLLIALTEIALIAVVIFICYKKMDGDIIQRAKTDKLTIEESVIAIFPDGVFEIMEKPTGFHPLKGIAYFVKNIRVPWFISVFLAWSWFWVPAAGIGCALLGTEPWFIPLKRLMWGVDDIFVDRSRTIITTWSDGYRSESHPGEGVALILQFLLLYPLCLLGILTGFFLPVLIFFHLTIGLVTLPFKVLAVIAEIPDAIENAKRNAAIRREKRRVKSNARKEKRLFFLNGHHFFKMAMVQAIIMIVPFLVFIIISGSGISDIPGTYLESIRRTFIPQAIVLFLLEPNLMLQGTRRPDKIWKIYLKPEYRDFIIQKMNTKKRVSILTPIFRAILSVISAVFALVIIAVDVVLGIVSTVSQKRK